MESRDNRNLRYILQSESRFFVTGFRVLQGQAENGLIPCSKSIQNGKIKLTYDITGYETLNDLLPVISPDIYQMILRNLFHIVLGVRTNGFLQYENISSGFDRMFIDTNNYSVHLIYLPLVTEQSVNSFNQFENSLRAGIADSFQRFPNLAGNALMNRLAQAVATRIIGVAEMADILAGNRLEAAVADQRAVIGGQSTHFNLGYSQPSGPLRQQPAVTPPPPTRRFTAPPQGGGAQPAPQPSPYPAPQQPAYPAPPKTAYSVPQPSPYSAPAPAPPPTPAPTPAPAPAPVAPSSPTPKVASVPVQAESASKGKSSLGKRLLVGGAVLILGLGLAAVAYFLLPLEKQIALIAAIACAALGLIGGVLIFLLAFKDKSSPSAATEPVGPADFLPRVEGGATELLDDVFIPALVLSGVKTPEKFDAVINKDEFIIGKNPDLCHAVIHFNPAISRVHCKIICRNGAYYIVDWGSSNGTFVNGNRIPPHQETSIRAGDRIKLANSQFELKSI
jgi:hypothetical protein